MRLAAVALVALAACSSGRSGGLPVPTPAVLVTAAGPVLTVGCSSSELQQTLGQVAELLLPYPSGYGGTTVAGLSLDGLRIHCGADRSTCSYVAAAQAIQVGRFGAGCVAHEIGHFACHRGFAAPGIACASVHHAGGHDLLGRTCSRDGQAPASCGSLGGRR